MAMSYDSKAVRARSAFVLALLVLMVVAGCSTCGPVAVRKITIESSSDAHFTQYTADDDLFLTSDEVSLWLKPCEWRGRGSLCGTLFVPAGKTAKFLSQTFAMTDLGSGEFREVSIGSDSFDTKSEMAGGSLGRLPSSGLVYKPYRTDGLRYTFVILGDPELTTTVRIALPKILVEGSTIAFPGVRLTPAVAHPYCPGV